MDFARRIKLKLMGNKRSIRSRFNRLLLVVYLLSLMMTIPAVYWYTKHDLYEQANQKLTLMVNMVSALRQYMMDGVRPTLLQRQTLYPTAIASAVATSHIAGYFKNLQPDYYIKVASDNPLNKANLPEPVEQDLLKDFRRDRQQTFTIREGNLKGQDYLFSASPAVSKSDCLVCHSTPETAPEMIRQQYGTQGGFGYQLDEVVGVSVVGVPLSPIKTAVIERSLVAVGMLTSLFMLILVVVNRMVRQQILIPLENITAAAQAISKGHLESAVVTLQHNRDDELSQLSHAIELMRRSFVKMMERVNRSR